MSLISAGSISLDSSFKRLYISTKGFHHLEDALVLKEEEEEE
jgi:hypothetical protein